MKIAISGAGIGGCTLAYWLLRSGHEPVLIEKAPRPRSGGLVLRRARPCEGGSMGPPRGTGCHRSEAFDPSVVASSRSICGAPLRPVRGPHGPACGRPPACSGFNAWRHALRLAVIHLLVSCGPHVHSALFHRHRLAPAALR